MTLLIEILISSIFTLYVLIYTTRVSLFKKDTNGLLVGMSLLAILFGLYLWIKNGLTLDYGTPEEIETTHAFLMLSFGLVNLFSGLVFIVISVFKYIVRRVKGNRD